MAFFTTLLRLQRVDTQDNMDRITFYLKHDTYLNKYGLYDFEIRIMFTCKGQLHDLEKENKFGFSL